MTRPFTFLIGPFVFMGLFSFCLFSCHKNVDTDPSSRSLSISMQRTFGGSQSDEGAAMAKTADGGYILAGWTGSDDGDVTNDKGSSDFFLVKIDAAGNKQWVKNYGGSKNDYPYGIIPTSDGGFLIAGITSSTDGDVTGNPGGEAGWLLKIDGSGNKQWDRIIEVGISFALAADGGFAVLSRNFDDLTVIKYDGSGIKQWDASFGGSGVERSSAIVSSKDGGFVITGYTKSTDGDATGSHGIQDYLVVKFDGLGKKQWAKVFGGSGKDDPFSILAANDGGYLVAGLTHSKDGDAVPGIGDADALVVKIDGSGNKQWSKNYGGLGSDMIECMTNTPNGGYVLAGLSSSIDGKFNNSHGSGEIWVLGLDGSGKEQWSRVFGGKGYENASAIMLNQDKSIFLVGTTDSNDGDVSGNHGNEDMWFVKLAIK